MEPRSVSGHTGLAQGVMVLVLVLLVAASQTFLAVPQKTSFTAGVSQWSAVAALVMSIVAWRDGEPVQVRAVTMWDSAIFFVGLALLGRAL